MGGTDNEQKEIFDHMQKTSLILLVSVLASYLFSKNMLFHRKFHSTLEALNFHFKGFFLNRLFRFQSFP